jgi:hypothetical protein
MDDFNLVRVSESGDISVHKSDEALSSTSSVEVELGSEGDEINIVEREEMEKTDATHVDDSAVQTVADHSAETYVERFKRKFRTKKGALVLSNCCWGLLCMILLIVLA